jgi:phosphopantetheinyl transferase (holo-ACP synthase)
VVDTVEIPGGVAQGMATCFRRVPWPYGPAQQFAAGRSAAAEALAQAGSDHRVVPRGRDGRPHFPAGFPGSISHTGRLAVAVVVPGAAAVGIDLEDVPIGDRVARFVLRERELHLLLPPRGTYTPRELFVAKEAAFKAMSGAGAPDGLLFWRIRLEPGDGGLLASHHDEAVQVRVRSTSDMSFAVAVRW